MASITYTLVAASGAPLDDYARIAGEAVRALRIEAVLGSTPRRVLLTESGREVVLPAAALATSG